LHLKLKGLMSLWAESEREAEEIDELLGKTVFGPIDSQTGVDMRFGDREFTLNSPPEVLMGIEFRRNLAIQK